MLLEQHGLTKIVEGIEQIPVEVCIASQITVRHPTDDNVLLCSTKVKADDGTITNKEAIMQWQKNDVLARNYLIATIESLQQRTLVNCKTANDMWVRLSTQHLQNAVENQHVLQQQFFEYKYQPDHDVMTHVTEIETMAAQLNDVGATVTPIQIMTKVICTLPPSYRNFISAWDSVPATEKTIALLTARLLKEETMSRRWNGGEQNEGDAAFFARNASESSNSHHDSDRRENTRTTWRGKGRGSYKSARQRMLCSYCHKPWHLAKVCRVRIRDEEREKEKEGHRRSSSNSFVSNETRERQDHSCISSSCFLVRNPTDWFADSGATQHMTDQLSIMNNFTRVPQGSWMVNGIGGTTLAVHGYGDINVHTYVHGKQSNTVIKRALYVPKLGASLLSVAAITDLGLTVTFSGMKVFFKRGEKVEMVGERVGKNLYHMAITAQPVQVDEAHLTSSSTVTIDIWHQRFGHTNYSNVMKMATLKLVDGLSLPESCTVPLTPCDGCAYGKMHRKSFPTGRLRGTHVGNLIHSDLCGPMQIKTPNRSRYFILFTDDFSGWRTVFFIQQKSEAFDCLKKYLSSLHNETGKYVQILRTDNGGEYCSRQIQEWLDKK